MKKSICVIGGGVAGLSAAFEAAENGADVTIYESSPRFGGRVAAGKGWDTGRHLITSSYHDFLHLLDILGTRHLLRMRHMTIGVVSGLRRSFWYLDKPLQRNAAPLLGLLGWGGLPLSARLKMVGVLKNTLDEPLIEQTDEELIGRDGTSAETTPDITVEELFRKHYWPKEAITRLGNALATAICNSPPYEAAAQPFIAAFRRIMNEPKKLAGWVIRDTEKLVTEVAPNALSKLGIKIKLGEAVKSVKRSGEEWEVQSADFKNKFDLIIVTTPPSKLGYLKDCPEADSLLKAASGVQSNSIITVRSFVEDLESLPGPIIEPVEKDPVWFAEPAADEKIVVEQVISGIPSGSKIDKEAYKISFAESAKRIFKLAELPGNVEFRRFEKATQTIKPGTPRPVLKQAQGLFYAGDWSATGLPPTLESAARAGRLAGKIAAQD